MIWGVWSVPKEIRKTLRIKEGTPIRRFLLTGDYSEKVFPYRRTECFCKGICRGVGAVKRMVCITDHDQVVAAAGQGSREYVGKPISKSSEDAITERSSVFANGNDRSRIPVTPEQREPLYSQIMQPIISAGDTVGSVLLLGKNERDVMG